MIISNFPSGGGGSGLTIDKNFAGWIDFLYIEPIWITLEEV